MEEFTAMGFSQAVAEALAENDLTVEDVKGMSEEEVFNKFLEWEGIIGYTGAIIRAWSNINMVKGATVNPDVAQGG